MHTFHCSGNPICALNRRFNKLCRSIGKQSPQSLAAAERGVAQRRGGAARQRRDAARRAAAWDERVHSAPVDDGPRIAG